MKIWYMLAMTLLSAWVLGAEYKLGKAENVKIDGKLDEACWQSAEKADGFVKLGVEGGKKAVKQTEAIMLVDGDALYFGITCHGIEGLKDNLKGTVTNAWANDLVELFISPTQSGAEYYQIVITAGGGMWNDYCEESGNIHPDPYNPSYELATGRLADAWTVEARIPFHAFYMTGAEAWQNKWFLNVVRWATNGRSMENSTWAPLYERNMEIRKFHKVTGIPAKPVMYDLRIEDAVFENRGRSGKDIKGKLNVNVRLGKAPAGKYTLELQGRKIAADLKAGTNSVTCDYSFDKDGRVLVPMTLFNARGEVVAKRGYPVLVEAQPLQVKFTAPHYGGNFYPGEDSSHLRGTVKVSTGDNAVVMNVSGKEYKLPVKDGYAVFDIDVSGIKGAIDVSIGELKYSINRIDDALAWIRDGKIIVNGKPAFQLGWYGGHGWITSHAFVEKYPKMGMKHPLNLGTWINLELPRVCYSTIERDEMVFDRVPSQKAFDAVKAVIERNRNSKSYIYYLSDEPECRGVSNIYLRHIYNYIKKHDPRRLVMIISRAPVAYIDCADIINPHPYISPSVDKNGKRMLQNGVDKLRDMCASVEALNKKDKALMLTPQAHCYSFNNIFADYPTFDENNASLWSSVCHGCQGFTPYIWYDHAARPNLDLGFDFAYQSANRLEDMLTSSDQERIPGDEGRVFRKDGKTMYVVVNVYNEKRTFELETGLKKLYVFRSDEEIKPVGGKVTLNLEPYGVRILTSEKMDEGLTTEKEVREAIAKADHERANRGNILFGRGREIELFFPQSRPYNLQNAMEQQDKMFDGNTFVSAWMPRSIVEPNLWYEMAFTTFVPRFTKARIYGWNLKGLKFKIWKFGKWIEPEAKRTEDKYSMELDFGKQLRTVKVRLEFVPKEAELYEFELIK